MYLLLFLWPSRAYTEAPASYEVGCIFKNKLVGDPQVLRTLEVKEMPTGSFRNEWRIKVTSPFLIPNQQPS